MFGVGWAEALVIAVVALIVVGPEKLPEAARSLGKLYGQIYRTLSEAGEQLRAEVDLGKKESKNSIDSDQSDDQHIQP